MENRAESSRRLHCMVEERAGGDPIRSDPSACSLGGACIRSGFCDPRREVRGKISMGMTVERRA
jgi:hypothetical protein